jgi:hypothetical protein
MEWGWIAFGVVALAGFGMWKANRRNKDPINHQLLEHLFLAAEVTDDITANSLEMRIFLDEVRKMQALDGGLKTGRRLAHLATMIPYYGNSSPIVKARAKLIIDRLVRNGA